MEKARLRLIWIRPGGERNVGARGDRTCLTEAVVK